MVERVRLCCLQKAVLGQVNETSSLSIVITVYTYQNDEDNWLNDRVGRKQVSLACQSITPPLFQGTIRTTLDHANILYPQ